ncbi:GATA transcription factor 26 isoform X2 [Wolffia australiana]
MGKQGPCHHCGITSTPLWRNGPPEKPILCNACGSRWRTKGTLTNYTPLHARENVDLKEIKVPKAKATDQKLHKRKQAEFLELRVEVEGEGEVVVTDQNFHRALEEDTSNRSSSGSAISYSESCSHFGGADGSEPAGAVQCNIWDSLVPSRKRSCGGRAKPSSVEKLTRDLHSILHQQASYISESPEDDLVYEAGPPLGSFEIGNGSVLLRHPNMATLDEESEASSLPVDNSKNTPGSESYSGVSSLPVNSVGKDFVNERVKRTVESEERVNRDKASTEKSSLLRSKDSPLTCVDLKEIVNMEVFVKYLTIEEQKQLTKYLPSIDASKPPESFMGMFYSPQFAENLLYFRQLLMEGTFEMSCSGLTPDESRNLKKLVLGSSVKSKWVEYHTRMKRILPCQSIKDNEDKRMKELKAGSGTLRSPNDRPSANPQEKKSIKSPKRTSKPKVASLRALNSQEPISMENTLSFCPWSGTFASPFQSNNECIYEEEDVLVDARPNGSFPEAELLSGAWKQNAGLISMSAESGASCNPTSSSNSQSLKHWAS